MLNKEGLPIELPCLLGMRVQAGSFWWCTLGDAESKTQWANFCTTPDRCYVIEIQRKIRTGVLIFVYYNKIISSLLHSQVLIENKEARGVRFLRHGHYHTVMAKSEVILSAGAYNSPHLLLLSGVGPKKHLEEFNVRLAVAVITESIKLTFPLGEETVLSSGWTLIGSDLPPLTHRLEPNDLSRIVIST